MFLDMNDICGLIDNDLAQLVHTVIVFLKIVIPVLLIVFGMIDFGKAVTAKKEDEILSARKTFIRRVISAILIFFVVTIVQLLINVFDEKDETGKSDIWDCANMILNGEVPEIVIIKDDENNSNVPEENIINTINTKTKTGLTCSTQYYAEEYDLCIENTTYQNQLPLLQEKQMIKYYNSFNDIIRKQDYMKKSMIEVNKENICGTIFKKECSYNGTVLWSSADNYNSEVINRYNWNDSLKNIEIIKNEFNNCYNNFGEKEDINGNDLSNECHEIFKAFFK